MPKITELDSVISLDGNDVLPIVSKNNNNEDETMKIAVNAIGTKLLNSNEYGALNTTDKKIIGAINEVNTKASQFDNMTATASGSIATFSNGGDDIPVSEFECEIGAQQASGTPTPTSPLPITGYSESDILVSGLNIFDIESWLDANSIAYTKTGDSITFTPNSSLYTNPYVFSDNDINVSASVTSFIYNGSNLRLEFLNKNNESQTVITSGNLERNNFNACKVRLNWSSMGTSVTVEKPMINLGSTASEFVSYTGNLYTVSFGQTIYGGRLIYANGQWSIEATSDIYTPTNISTIVGQTRITGGWAFTISNAPQIYKQGGNAISNINIVDDYLSMTVSGFAKVLSNRPVFVLMDSDSGLDNTSTQEQIKTAFQTFVSTYNPVAVYEIATPVIIPTTSSTRVKTISGDNNIYSSTGDCELKYFTNKADSLAELIKAFVV